MSVKECVQKTLQNWQTHDMNTIGDLLFDNLYGQYVTWAFLLPSLEKKRVSRNKKILRAKSGAVGWISGSGSANCFFLLTFNSPKRPCFTASWAIAFLNLSLERQELWSLSIEEKGMLFPCHPLVAPPSSLPWSTAWLPPYPIPPSLVPTLLSRKLPAMSLPWAVEMRTMTKCSGGVVGVLILVKRCCWQLHDVSSRECFWTELRHSQEKWWWGGGVCVRERTCTANTKWTIDKVC